ncbi:MAG: ABC transporter substrate-binding protein, partial [Ferruginibacter sp.]
MNVGILYPRSKAHPGIAQDFMDGIKAYTGPQPNGITLISESIGYGGSEKEVYEKAEKLLVIEGVDVLVAYIGEKVIEILHPLLQASGKLMLVVHPGANYPGSWMPQANIINLTLQDAFLCWLCGKDAVNGKQKDAVMASTFYDCGYLHLATMTNGLVNAGGNIVFNYINKGAYDNSFHIDELEGFLNETTTLPNLLCVFDELPASLFYDKFNSYVNAAKPELFVSPMMLEPGALSNAEARFKFPVKGYSPWQAAVETPGGTAFRDAFGAKFNRKPGLFSLLGWETGMILKQVHGIGSAGFEDGAGITSALQKIKLNSPRGEMTLDPTTNYFLAPIVQCSIDRDRDKMTTLLLDFPQEAWSTYIQQPTDGSGSGWTNTYLCY